MLYGNREADLIIKTLHCYCRHHSQRRKSLVLNACTVYLNLNGLSLFYKATNEVVTRVPEATQDEMQAAVDSCKRAYKSWSKTTVLTRQQVMFNFQNLIKHNLVHIWRVHVVW
jgi:acyl-CoA reductase-like NAD-dependent aldehyde dehydrogenase